MSTYYSPGCTNDKAHICDVCEVDDGRPTLYWENKDFNVCYECLTELCKNHLDIRQFSGRVKIVRARVSEELRNKIYERDGYKCVLCGSNENLCLDHKTPFIFGGHTNESNLQTLCKSCNSKKGSK
jgi:5-methylcytosine-specific restriction endonuclease McrA